jgi:hypothetical protein
MKIVRLIIVTFLMLALTPAVFAKKRNHTDGVGQVGEPCEVLTCMAGKAQGDNQPACQSVNQRFFNVRVFTPYYNPEATARLRQSILNTCPGAAVNKNTLEMIIQRYGRSLQE